MDFWAKYAKQGELRVAHSLGSRCRHCGFMNEPDEDYVVCLLRDMRCEFCGLAIPGLPVATAPGVDPFEQANRHFRAVCLARGDR